MNLSSGVEGLVLKCPCQITLSVPPQAKSGLKGVQSLLMYKVKSVASARGQWGGSSSWLTHPLPRKGTLACRGVAP